MTQPKQEEKIEILDKTLKLGFSSMPRIVLRLPNLSRNCKTTYSLLLDYAWQSGSCFPGQERLANDLGISIRTLRRDLDELKDFGLIDWKQRGRNKTNVYYILSLEFLHKRDGTNMSGLDESNLTDPDGTKMTDIIEEDNKNRNKYKQTLTLSDPSTSSGQVHVDNFNSLPDKTEINVNERYKLESFDKEAVILAEELGDSKSIKYFQKIINKRDKGEIEDDDIQEALNQTRKAISESKGDGTNFLQNPSAWFVSILKKLIQKRDQKKRSEQLEEFKHKLLANKSI